MADIELSRSHSLGVTEGREAVERVAKQLEEDIGVTYQWSEDTLHFDGQGAEGHIEVEQEMVQIAIHLSAFLRPMQSRLRKEAERYLDRHLQS